MTPAVVRSVLITIVVMRRHRKRVVINSFDREWKSVRKICTGIVNILERHALVIKKGAINDVFQTNFRKNHLSFEKRRKIAR